MPTFRNDTDIWVDCWPTLWGPEGEKKEVLVRFQPGETRALRFWLPWQEKGLTLVDPDNPPVPMLTLTSGTYEFNLGDEREFQIPKCDRYVLDVIVHFGRVRLFAGNDAVGTEVAKRDIVPWSYRGFFDWERAPRLRMRAVEPHTRATLHAETGFGRIEDIPCR